VEALLVAEGLWRWTAAHPSWEKWPNHEREAREVGCVYYEAPDATVLVDPLVPAGEEEAFFRHLDADVERRGLRVVILLTAAWHRRSADELAARYDARIGGTLPEGVEELAIEGADERQVAYFIRPHAALVVAEIFGVDVDGELYVASSPALKRPEQLEASLDRIMELPVERLLVSHGEPVLEDAKARMAEALARRQ
jgi:glyoxylase-like metal-dependent hydrolase (beta-lactamase superfamily II)